LTDVVDVGDLIKNELLPVLHPAISVHYAERNGPYHVYSCATGKGNAPQPELIAAIPVDILLSLIGERIVFHVPLGGKNFSCVVGADWFQRRHRTGSNRLAVFKKATHCVVCGTEAKEWQMSLQSDGEVHLDLKAENGCILTRDHIIPQSKYRFVFGTNKEIDSMQNSQVMCEICNNDKSDTLPEGVFCWFDETTIGNDNWII